MGLMCTVTENNKLIAEFMGVRNIDDTKYIENLKEMRADGLYFEQGYMTSELKYDTDWNWLMEVVEKIESLGVNFWTVKNKVKLTLVGDIAKKLNDSLYDTEFEGYDFEYYIEGTKIEATYQAVVEFIKWYNK